jgi:LacI family transcriptional regulator
MSAKLSDIAAAVGVSASTVSRILSGRGGPNPELAERILQAAEEFGYPLERYSTAMRRSRLIGVVVPNIASPFYSTLIERIEQAAFHHGYSLLLTNSNYDARREQECLQILVDKDVAGILISPVTVTSTLPSTVAHRRVPVVQVDRHSDEIHGDLVQTDGHHGAREAVRMLVQRGYRRIAIVSGPASHSTGRERLDGYFAALGEAGLAMNPEYVRIVGFREEDGFAAVQALLRLTPIPDALFVTNVDMTIGALRALYEAGVQIPAQMAVIGFDDFPFARIVAPPLTTVEQPIEMLALTAVDLLMRRIVQHTTAGPTTIRLLPKLNIRASTPPGEGQTATLAPTLSSRVPA